MRNGKIVDGRGRGWRGERGTRVGGEEKMMMSGDMRSNKNECTIGQELAGVVAYRRLADVSVRGPFGIETHYDMYSNIQLWEFIGPTSFLPSPLSVQYFIHPYTLSLLIYVPFITT